MLKERFEKCRNFVKEHKTEIIIGGITITVTVAACMGYNINKERIEELERKVAKNGKIAKESLKLHLERIDFEIDALEESIERLDPEVSINKFENIPKRKQKINELILQRLEITDKLHDCEE